jgi:preprotein translocase subunit SecE
VGVREEVRGGERKKTKMANPIQMIRNAPQFIQQVRAETAKVTWPTRQETITTTIMVFIMVTLTAIFFLLVDQVLNFMVQQIVALGG